MRAPLRNPSAALGISVGVALGVVLMHGPATAASMPANASTLSVCIDTSSPVAPMDRKLAQAVASQQHRALAVHEFDGSGDDDGYDYKNFRALAADQCQIILGYPLDATRGTAPAGLVATAPYGRIGFVLVTPSASRADSLASLPKGTDVAVTNETMPNLYFENHPNIAADIYQKDADTIASLVEHHDRAAMVWRPTIVSYLLAHHLTSDFKWHQLDEPHARWNLVGLHDPAQAGAASAFDHSVAALRDSGGLEPLLSPYASVSADGTRGVRRSDAGTGSPILLVSAAAAMTQPAAGGGSPDAAPALYTAAQADAGKQKFADNCAQCHGDNLEGMAGPALKGDLFASAKANFHVGDIFNIVVKNMPSTQPGSLSHDDYTQIMAYILQQNGYPAGSNPLVFDATLTSNVPLIYRGK
ncbi:c-type cytochrome [Lichenicoccus roseus]|uniref:Cytochrome c class I n=1 Tax=Lichenicoccus roseus TaxID=2683649 RepID=A0A5R9J3H9_9PROT|nr:cytochrome c [Lichenicoccus roseus]TLU72174.1 cytochrome c class I [Lichenicoccus roseus]